MVILSQDKIQMINFDNVNEIFTTETGEILVINNTYITDDCLDVLGKYKTEERAKEVLKEISMYNTRFNFFKYVCVDAQNIAAKNFLKDNVAFDLYEMPEK